MGNTYTNSGVSGGETNSDTAADTKETTASNTPIDTTIDIPITPLKPINYQAVSKLAPMIESTAKVLSLYRTEDLDWYKIVSILNKQLEEESKIVINEEVLEELANYQNIATDLYMRAKPEDFILQLSIKLGFALRDAEEDIDTRVNIDVDTINKKLATLYEFISACRLVSQHTVTAEEYNKLQTYMKLYCEQSYEFKEILKLIKRRAILVRNRIRYYMELLHKIKQ